MLIASKAATAKASLLAALLIAISTTLAAQPPSPGLVVFGDSLSDSGNVFVVNNTGFDAGANNVPPGYRFSPGMNPDAAYARGGHHLSNGETWIEIVARDLGYGVNANPAFASENPLATNYAVAGARAYDRADADAIDLGDEVQAFLADFGAGNAPAQALYVIAIGSNDLADASLLGDPTLPAAALNSIAASIVALYQNGARDFLVLGAPDMGLLPITKALGDPAAGSAGSFAFNAALQLLVLQPLQSLPGITIRYFDLWSALNDIYANYTAFGFTERDLPCVTPDVAPFVCRNPDQYIFWDGIHPTRAAHAVLADKVEEFLAP